MNLKHDCTAGWLKIGISMRIIGALGIILGVNSARVSAMTEASDGALRVEVLTAYNLVVDSNAESPSTYAPSSAYMSAKIYNDGTTALTNVFAYIGDEAAGTPGLYPQRPQPPLVGPLGGDFALNHEGGSIGTDDATRYLGTIEPGEYVSVYCGDNVCALE